MKNKPEHIPFHRTYVSGREQQNISNAISSGHTCAGGEFSRLCEAYLEKNTGARKALLTNSCTSALEIAALTLDIDPGDEVIMPTFTFTSTATAFVNRGAIPVFVDIRADTLNINQNRIEAAITPRTKAIVPVHYAGVAADMDTIMKIASAYKLWVVEDAAQAVEARYNNRPLGTIGHLGCYSFHMTKNISCGEGGALLVNDDRLPERAEVIHDKGTNRAMFRAGAVTHYEWVDIAHSAPPSELQAAFLLAQLEAAKTITKARLELWHRYRSLLTPLERHGLSIPCPPKECDHNAHIFPLVFANQQIRDRARKRLAEAGIDTALHYRPLHQSPAGKRLARTSGDMAVSEALPDRLLRLPLWPGLPERTCDVVAEQLEKALFT